MHLINGNEIKELNYFLNRIKKEFIVPLLNVVNKTVKTVGHHIILKLTTELEVKSRSFYESLSNGKNYVLKNFNSISVSKICSALS